MPEDQEAREARVRKELRANGLGLLGREDGFYNVTEGGVIMAPNRWRVRERGLNDRGGTVGDAVPANTRMDRASDTRKLRKDAALGGHEKTLWIVASEASSGRDWRATGAARM